SQPMPYYGKFFDADGSIQNNQSQRTDLNWPIYRYAEVLLLFAEAENEANGPTADAYSAINQVRARARLPPLAGLSQDQFRDAVHQERSWELAFESKRLFDLKRWGTFYSVLSQDAVAKIGVQSQLLPALGPRVTYGVTFRSRPVIEASPLGVLVDGLDLGQGVEAGKVESYRANEHYDWRGVHSQATNRFNGARVALRHAATRTDYVVDVRVFDDGIAFRCVVPGEVSRVPDEATAFMLPAGATVWYHDLRGHYEGVHTKKAIADVPAGDWAAPPLTIKLPQAAGYAAITEAAVIQYAGMVLQADGQGGFSARLGHAAPASYPFTLRYGAAEAARLAQPAAVSGPLTTPWRVVMVGSNLYTLVNCDIVSDLSPPPDPRYFPQGLHTDWVKPGRAVWKYLEGGGQNTLETMKEFSRLAAELGFEYNLVEGFWQRWSETELRELIDYSRARHVGVWLWKHSRDIRDPAARAAFFQHAQEGGAVGVKLDFREHG